MTNNFQFNVTAKIHRSMKCVSGHLIFLGCLRRGSSEENGSVHKAFKEVYPHTNNQVEAIAPQLLLWTINSFDNDSYVTELQSDDDDEWTVTLSILILIDAL